MFNFIRSVILPIFSLAEPIPTTIRETKHILWSRVTIYIQVTSEQSVHYSSMIWRSLKWYRLVLRTLTARPVIYGWWTRQTCIVSLAFTFFWLFFALRDWFTYGRRFRNLYVDSPSVLYNFPFANEEIDIPQPRLIERAWNEMSISNRDCHLKTIELITDRWTRRPRNSEILKMSKPYDDDVNIFVRFARLVKTGV